VAINDVFMLPKRVRSMEQMADLLQKRRQVRRSLGLMLYGQRAVRGYSGARNWNNNNSNNNNVNIGFRPAL
jgi:hypothetical protein